MLASWTILLASGIAAGAAGCAALVARRGAAAAAAVGSGIAIALLLYSIAAIVRFTERIGIGLAAGAISIGAVIGGFCLAAALVPLFTATSAPPSVACGKGQAPPALVVLADGQPEHYEPAATTQSFDRLTDSDVPLPPLAVRAFAYLSDRGRYRAAGLDPARPVVRAVTARATGLLRSAGYEGAVHEAWLHGTPRLADAVAKATTEGASHVAVAILDVAESYECDLAMRELAAVSCGGSLVPVAVTPPLWSEDALARLVSGKVLAALGDEPKETDGAVIVANGQPPQWDRTHPEATGHRTYFCQRVRALLIESGLSDTHVKAAWLDWHDPDVTEVVRHLSAVGCEHIVVVPATWPADTLEVILDLPSAVAGAAPEDSVTVDVLHGWGEDEAVAQVLARVAGEALEELGWERRGAGQ